MTSLVVGADGLLGHVLMGVLVDAIGTTRRHKMPKDDLGRASHYLDLRDSEFAVPPCHVAYLCAGTKGFAENEGNREAFRADVDGNIRLARFLLDIMESAVVFVSSDGVEWGGHTAYARHRLLVEMALIMRPRVAVVRAAKFTGDSVRSLAATCAGIGHDLVVGRTGAEGLHYWPAAERR